MNNINLSCPLNSILHPFITPTQSTIKPTHHTHSIDCHAHSTHCHAHSINYSSYYNYYTRIINCHAYFTHYHAHSTHCFLIPCRFLLSWCIVRGLLIPSPFLLFSSRYSLGGREGTSLLHFCYLAHNLILDRERREGGKRERRRKEREG